jgi:hypothetical protein
MVSARAAAIARGLVDRDAARVREQDDGNGAECICCRAPLFLRDGCDWPDDGDVLCDGCTDDDRRAYLAALMQIAALGGA